MEFKTINEILDFAIKNEQDAADFYYNLASNSDSAEMKETFLQYAKEEEGHKFRIEKIKESGNYNVAETKVLDLKIGDYLVEVKESETITYQEALVIAMKREKSAFKLYMKLAQVAPNEDLKKTFKKLANDEAKHKLRFEIEYDELIYKEN